MYFRPNFLMPVLKIGVFYALVLGVAVISFAESAPPSRPNTNAGRGGLIRRGHDLTQK